MWLEQGVGGNKECFVEMTCVPALERFNGKLGNVRYVLCRVMLAEEGAGEEKQETAAFACRRTCTCPKILDL